MSVYAAAERVASFARRRLDEACLPGLALVLTDRTDTLHQSGHGVSDRGSCAPVSPQTLFEIGSISKGFTAAAVLRQAEERRIDLFAPIQSLLPWFDVPAGGTAITAHHLLTHTAGLPSGNDIGPNSRAGCAAMRERETVTPPGVRYHYSNLGYEVLGYLLEDLLGEEFGVLLDRLVLTPLGMRQSAATITHAVRPRMAVGHVPKFDDRPRPRGNPLVPAPWHETASACGSVAASAEEMALWMRSLLNRGAGLLSTRSFAQMSRAHVRIRDGEDYGYGLRRRQMRDRLILGHSGGMVGFHSDMALDLEAGLGAAVLVNASARCGWIASDITGFALEALRAAACRSEPPPEPLPLDEPATRDAACFEGTYHAVNETLVVEADGAGLQLRRGNGRWRLLRRGDGEFCVDDPRVVHPLKFQRIGGAVVSLTLGPLRASRNLSGPAGTVPTQWRSAEGHYRSFTPWDTNFRVFARGEELVVTAPPCCGGETVLVPEGPGLFRLGEGSPEWLRFDTVIGGMAQRALLSGVPYTRVAR